MQHRIFVVPALTGLTADAARRHWEERHGHVFAGTPGLLHYRQNRPVEQEWARGRAQFCSETWYADRDSERAAYDSAHYREVVTPDEASFLDRDAAWSAVVLGGDSSGPGEEGLRVLWFDQAPPAGPDWQQIRLTRTVPAPGTGRLLHVGQFEDEAEALALTKRAVPLALVCRSVHDAFAPEIDGLPNVAVPHSQIEKFPPLR